MPQNKQIEILSTNIEAIEAIVDTVSGTLGPKGLDVMLIDDYGDISCTNDGVEILERVEIQHPVAKLAIEAAKAQEHKIGDGTTTVAVLCAAILRESLKLINKPQTNPSELIREMPSIYQQNIRPFLQGQAKELTTNEQAKAIINIAARGDTEISSLLLEAYRQNLKYSKTVSLSNSIHSRLGLASEIIEGIYIPKKSHYSYSKKFHNAKVLIIEGAFEPEAMPAEAVSTDEGTKRFQSHIQALMDLSKRIIKLGIEAIFVDASMLALAEEYFAQAGVYVLTRVKKSDLKEIASSTGAQLLTKQKLINSSNDELLSCSGLALDLTISQSALHIQGKNNYKLSVLIGAETPDLLKEKERIAIDAARSLEAALDSGFVAGSGIVELNLSKHLASIGSPAAIALSAALKAPFRQILANAGYNSEDYESRFADHWKGLDLDSGEIIDLEAKGIIDPLALKLSAIHIAIEIALQVLKINRILKAKKAC